MLCNHSCLLLFCTCVNSFFVYIILSWYWRFCFKDGRKFFAFFIRFSNWEVNFSTFLTLSWRKSLSFRNHYSHLLCKSMKWFLYDRNLRHERVSINIEVVLFIDKWIAAWFSCGSISTTWIASCEIFELMVLFYIWENWRHEECFIASKMINIVIIWDALLDLLPFAQFKKHEKHQWRILCILMNS